MPIKRLILLSCLLFLCLFTRAQKVVGIYFHLYTDSLKKGTHNYINVDGKLSNGRWLPLTAKEIQFSSTAGTFEGNDLIVPFDFAEEKITVKAVLKSNTNIWKEVTIWIKKKPDPEKLPTKEEILKKHGDKKREVNYSFVFFASSINLARPISVNGCFNKPRIGSRGQVQT